MERRTPDGQRIAGWLSVVLGLLLLLVGGYLLSHFIRIGPDIALVYVWSGGLVVLGGGMTAAGIWVLPQRRL